MTPLEERFKRVKVIICDVDGTLTDGAIWFDGEGRQFRSVHARDTMALTLWNLAGGRSALMSGLGNSAMETIAETWKCVACRQWIKNKALACRELSDELGVALEDIAFVGDDIIDVRAMQVVGLAVAVGDAAPEAKEVAHFVTDAPGGRGALRELVYRILEEQGRLVEVIERYCDREDHSTSPWDSTPPSKVQ